MPASSDSYATSMRRCASPAPVPPTTYERAESDTQPRSVTPQSIEMRSPSTSGSSSGMPCTTLWLLLVQSVADVETIRKVAPSNFHPRPAVDSAIVRIIPNAAKRALVGDVKKFREFLRDLYTLRRKNLRSVLSGWPRGKSDKAEVDAKLVALGIDGTIRAEMLDVETHLRLCEVFG